MTKETTDQRGERIAAELRAATSEAAGVLKDLQATLKHARTMVDDYAHNTVMGILNTYTATWQGDAERFILEAKANIVELRDQMCEKAAAHIAADVKLHEVIHAVSTEVIDILRKDGYDFVQPGAHD